MIYLDNAATTFPKPACMSSEIERCIRTYCGNPGRSGHILSMKAAEKIYECRQLVANLFNSSKPENVIFTLNTTHALNIAIKTLCKKGAHVLISNMEHNSVVRPVYSLSNQNEIYYHTFNVLQPPQEILYELESKRRSNTEMLIMTHASNICGMLFPIREIGEFCHRNNIIFIVDAAQSAGIADINIKQDHIDALCLPAHKGLYGPQGLGIVIFGDKTPTRTLIEGGNGTNSLSPDMGIELPESFEAGTLPTPLIAGLAASIKWLNSIGVKNINHHEKKLAAKLSEMLLSLPGSVIYGMKQPQTGIVLYNNKNVKLNAISDTLNKMNICTRSGFHCAPLAHKSLGTNSDGALRISFSFFNTNKDVDKLYTAIKRAVI